MPTRHLRSESAGHRRLSILLSALVVAACASATPSVRIPPGALPNPQSSPFGGEPRPEAATRGAQPLPEAVQELQRTILGGHGAADVVESLTTEVGARLAGSPTDRVAVAWALATMRARGLADVHAEPVKVPVWQRGVETASLVAPVRHTLEITALGWSGATPAKGIVGDIVRFDSVDALMAADPHAVAGKVVFIDTKMRETEAGAGYGAAVVTRRAGPAAAASKGALAVVIRSIGSDDSRFPHTGAMQKEKNLSLALPAGALSNADADLVDRILMAHGSARIALNLGPHWLPDADSANVVGEIRGRDLPGEVVLLGAHLDSWDLGEGAIDDGAGCGIVLEAGRALAALATRPRRTIRVVLFAAEENSLAGAKEYARAHAAEAANIVAAMEADSGTGKVVRAALVGAADARGRFIAIGALLEPLGVRPVEAKGMGGADVSTLGELGVPLVDLRQDEAHYFHTHHTANDTFARIDATALTQAAAAFATTAWGIAEASRDFGRVPVNERDGGW